MIRVLVFILSGGVLLGTLVLLLAGFLLPLEQQNACYLIAFFGSVLLAVANGEAYHHYNHPDGPHPPRARVALVLAVAMGAMAALTLLRGLLTPGFN